MKIKYIIILFVLHISNCQAAAIKQPQLTDKEVQLFEAIYNNNVPKIKKLIDERVNVNVISSENKEFFPEPNVLLYIGETPLHFAVKNPSLQTIKLLLDSGADINARDLQDGTPLMGFIHDLADSKETLTILELLLNYGADTKKINNLGQSVIEIAEEHYKRNKIDLDRAYGYPTIVERLRSHAKNLEKIIELLIAHTARAKIAGQELKSLGLPPEVAAVAQSYLAAGDWEKNKTQIEVNETEMDLSEDLEKMS